MRRALSVIGVVAVLVLYPTLARTQTGGAPPGNAGAPGGGTCSQESCHVGPGGGTGNLNTGPGVLTIEAPDAYVPGAPLTFTVRLRQDGIFKFGFQATLRTNQGNQFVGTFAHVEPNKTGFFGAATDYVTHRSPDGLLQTDEATWTVQWNPPADDAGPVTIYAAGNASNGNGQSSGDLIYTAQHTLTPDLSADAEDIATPAFALYPAFPNPAAGHTTVSYDLKHPAPVTIRLVDALGREVRLLDLGMQPRGAHTTSLHTSDLAPGTYFVTLHTPTAQTTRSLVVAR